MDGPRRSNKDCPTRSARKEHAAPAFSFATSPVDFAWTRDIAYDMDERAHVNINTKATAKLPSFIRNQTRRTCVRRYRHDEICQLDIVDPIAPWTIRPANRRDFDGVQDHPGHEQT